MGRPASSDRTYYLIMSHSASITPSDSREQAASHTKWTLVTAVLLGAVIAIVYGRSLHDPFIFDDETTITENPSIVRLWPLVGDAEHPGPLNPPREMPTSGRPLVNLTFALNYAIGEMDPVGYRLFNLVVHWLSALLLFGIVRRTLELPYFGDRFLDVANLLATAVALLWAVHPLQTEAVVYVTQRTELMVGLFYLATLYTSLRYWTASTSKDRTRWLLLAALACAAGMTCKEVMVSAPVMVLLFDWIFISGSLRNATKQSWRLYAALALSWLVLLGLNYGAPRSLTAGFHLGVPVLVYWFTQCKVLLMYLKLAVWPWPLTIRYSVAPLLNFSEAWPWALTVAGLFLATAVLLWRRSAFGFLGTWVLVVLLPTLVIPITTEVAAERRMYLPLAAIVAGFVVGGYALANRFLAMHGSESAENLGKTRQWIATATISGVLVVVLICVSVKRVAAYDTAIAIWEDAVSKAPDDPIVHNNLGTILSKANRNEEAKEEFRRTIQIAPERPIGHRNFADTLVNVEQYDDALREYRTALTLNPDDYLARNRLGSVLLKIGQVPEAIEAFKETIRRNPDYHEAYYNLANVLNQTGRTDEAIKNYERAIQLNPNFADAHYNLGLLLVNQGRLADAVSQWKQALQIKPDYAEAENNLGHALSDLGQPEEAIEHLQAAIRLIPDYLGAYANLANALAKLQRRDEAVAAAQKGIDLAMAQHRTAEAQQLQAWLTKYQSEPAPVDQKSPPGISQRTAPKP
jgi:protein O-mannosyl-transferase